MRFATVQLRTLKAIAAATGFAAALIQPIPEAFSQQPAMGDHAAPH
jgi:hypothetical protein